MFAAQTMIETKHGAQDAALELSRIVERFLKGYGGYLELSVAQETFVTAMEKQTKEEETNATRKQNP